MTVGATLLAVSLAGALIGYFYILFAVVLKNAERKESDLKTPAEFMRAILLTLLTLLIILPTALWAAFAAIGNHVFTNWPLYAGLSVIVLTADLVADHHKALLETYDKINTEFWVPIYSDGIVVADNVVRIFYDIVICWWNLYLQLFNIFFQETVRILIDCTVVNWEDVAEAVVILIEAPYEAFIQFVADSGEERFDLERIYAAGGVLLGALFDIGECSCTDLGFFWNWAKEIVQSTNLHKALDRLGNLPADFFRPVIKFLFELFGNFPTPFSCPPSGAPRIACIIAREPKWDMMFDDATEFFKFSGFWIDDILRATLDIFFDYTSAFSASTIPLIGYYAAIIPNWALRVIQISMDIITHVDLVFTDNYLRYVDFTLPVQELFCLSLGFEDFWTRISMGSGVPELALLGSGTAKIFNSTLETYIFYSRLSQTALFNTLDLPDFIDDYDYDPIWQQYSDGWGDIVAFARFLDVELGDFIEFRFRRTQTWFQIWITIFVHLPTLTVGTLTEVGDFMTNELDPLIEQFREESRNYAAAGGNLVRQIGQFSPVEPCPNVPLTAPESVTDAFEDKEFFCCLGDLIHSFFLLQTEGRITVLEFFSQIVAIRGLTITLLGVLNTLVDRYDRILARADGLINGFGCLFPASLLNYVACPNSDGIDNILDAFPDTTTLLDPGSEQVSNVLRRPFTDVLNITFVTTLRLQRIVVVCLRELVDSGYSASGITRAICCLLIGLYDISVAIITKVVQSVINIFVCFVDAGFSENDNDRNFVLWDLFGWDGLSVGNPNSVINLRDELCVVIDAILVAVEFLVTIVNAAEAFFIDAINFLESIFVNGLTAAFEMIEAILLNAIQATIDLIFAGIQGVIDLVKGPVEDEVNDMIDFINSNLVAGINTLFCSITRIIDDLGDCFTGETITLNIESPALCIDLPGPAPEICIPGADDPGDLFDIDITFPDPGGIVTCILNINVPIFDCAPVVPDVLPVDFCKRSDLSDEEYYMGMRKGTVRPGKKARYGDPDGRILLTPEPEPEHVKLARKERFDQVRQIRRDYKRASRKGDLDKFYVENRGIFEDLILENATLADINMREIRPTQPCYAFAVKVFGSTANYSSDGTIELPFNNATHMKQIIFNRFNGTNVDDIAAWDVLSRGLMDFENCYASAAIIRFLNFQLGLTNLTSIPEDILFNPLSGVRTAARAVKTAVQIGSYQYNKSNFTNITLFNETNLENAFNQSITFEEFYNASLHEWEEWADLHNITDPVTLHWGRIVDRFRFMADLFGVDSFSRLTGGIGAILRLLRAIFYDVPTLLTGQLFPIPDDPATKRDVPVEPRELRNNTKSWEEVMEIIGAPYRNMMDSGLRDSLERFGNFTSDYFYRGVVSNDPKIIKNRLTPFRISRIVRNAIRDNIANRNFDRAERFVGKWERTENYARNLVVDLTIDKRTTSNERRQRLEDELEVVREKRAILQSSTNQSSIFTYQTRDIFGGLIDPIDLDPCAPSRGGAALCLDCILLDRWLDRTVFEICECITATVGIVTNAFNFQNTLGTWGGDPTAVPFPSTYPRSGNDPNILPLKKHDGSLLIPSEDEQDNSTEAFRQSLLQYRNDVIARFNTIPILPSGPFNLNKLAVNLIFLIPRLLTGDVDFDTLLDDVAAFFINPDASANDNAYNIVGFAFRCRRFNYVCSEQTRGEGIGLISALIWVPTVLIILSFILPRIIGPSRIVITLAWASLPALILSFAYYWVPGCGFALPDCAMDDFHDMITYFDVECTPWHLWLPGLTTPICPGAPEDFTRIFPDCRNPPYNFKDGFRNLFVSLEIVWPGFNEYVRETSNLLVSWIPTIDHLNQALTFPFPTGQVPDDFKSCNKVTFGNFSALLAFATIGLVIFGALAYAVYLLFTAIIALIELIIDAISQTIATNANPQNPRSSYIGIDHPLFKNYAIGSIPMQAEVQTLPTTTPSTSNRLRHRLVQFTHDKTT